MFLVYTSSRSLIIQFDRRLLIFHSHRKLLVIKATKLQEISTFHNSKNGLLRGPPLVYTKERSLDPNHTIFKNSAPKYTYSQNISQFCDLACSTFCMVLHGFLVDSLLISEVFWDCIFASLWGAYLRFASLWRANSLGDSCALGVHLSNVCWGLLFCLRKAFIF